MHAAMEDAEKVAQLIGKAYMSASDRLGREALRIFEKFRQKYGLTDAEARKILNKVVDKADINSLLNAIRNSGMKSSDLLKQLEAPAYAARLARLARLQRDIDSAMQEMYQLENKQSHDFYMDLAQDQFNRSMYEIQQRAGYGFSFSHVNKKHIEKMLNEPWSGKHFSKRIWSNTKHLAEELKDEMLVTLLTGRTDREAAHSIADKFSTGYMQARRLVRTEACWISNEMSMDSYEEAGIEKYRYVATLDLLTSQICRSLDGKEYKVSDRKPGTNCPPMHPWCRSTTIAAPTAEELATMKRRARDPATGKTYLVPASMTYEEWYRKYVEEEGTEEENKDTKKTQEEVRPVTESTETRPETEAVEIVIPEEPGFEDRTEQISNPFTWKDALTSEGLSQDEWKDRWEEFARPFETGVTEADKAAVMHDGDYGYFMTRNSYYINSQLYAPENKDKTLEEIFTRQDKDGVYRDLETVKALDRMIASHQTAEDAVYTRYVDKNGLSGIFGFSEAQIKRLQNAAKLDPAKLQKLNNSFAGKTSFSRAYTSTSAAKDKTVSDRPGWFERRLYVPKGTNAYAPTEARWEAETVFGRNLRTRIMKVDVSDDGRVVIHEMVEKEPVQAQAPQETSGGFRKGDPIPWQEAMTGANPNWSDAEDADKAYKGNCQKSVLAYEMRRRGYDVEAQPYEPKSRDEDLAYHNKYLQAFKDAKIERIHGTKDDPPKVDNPFGGIRERMAEWGNGSRGIVSLTWTWRRGGHVIMVEQINGETRFIDPQSGREADLTWISQNAELGQVDLIRTDKLEPTEMMWKEIVRPVRSAGVIQTGGHHYTAYEFENERDSKAREAYEKYSREYDVDLIAANTGFSKEEIMSIKRHIFFNKHRLYSKYGFFEPDYDMAVAWKRLREGKTLSRDILLLQHELLESKVEKMYNLSASEAHEIATREFDWATRVLEETEGGEADGLL